jgi:hypothetical protein
MAVKTITIKLYFKSINTYKDIIQTTYLKEEHYLKANFSNKLQEFHQSKNQLKSEENMSAKPI